jgi:NADP-dependent 3-hydroxy acid dehydrogenase YdfG
MKSFQQKIIVITGAGSGIGRALAQALAREGAKLALNDYQAATLQETVDLIEKEHPAQKIFASAFDVADKDQMFGFAQAVASHFGAVDVLFNNAGIAIGSQAFDAVDLNHIERLIDINFKGVVYGCKAFIPYLLQRSEAVLVNTASVFGLTGVAQGEAYVASKFAVNGLTLSLMQTYRGTGLRVHCVYPGGINTNIVANGLGQTPKDQAMAAKLLRRSPASAADVILNGIRRNKRRILIGYDAHALDAAVRAAPIMGCNIVNKIIEVQSKTE